MTAHRQYHPGHFSRIKTSCLYFPMKILTLFKPGDICFSSKDCHVLGDLWRRQHCITVTPSGADA